MSEDIASRLTMTRPRRDEIDPMVPEFATDTYAADGGGRITTAGGVATDAEAEAPLVPDLS
ncbi:hypothetical protein ACFR9U_00570 [Halorientalis brevis]|uniref:Uncharacterized protein n=1 Tax=Halorientalis brevis TaxID=1126241 RepID=A0ABD6C5Z5_9EURY|nr:hypothetical protein [Halorientalis brevis]